MKQNQYYSEFPSGFSKLTVEILKNHLNINADAIPEILQIADKFLLYSADLSTKSVRELGFFEVSYFVIKFFSNNAPIQKQLDWCYENSDILIQKLSDFSQENSGSFRIVTSRPTGRKDVFNNQIVDLEMNLSVFVRIDRGQPDFEIRLIEKDNYGLIGIRITKPAEYIDSFQRNSVRKEIAYYMNYLSEPSDNDVLIDPMCGGGIIPIIRSQIGPAKRIIAADADLSSFKEKLHLSALKPFNFEKYEADLNELESLLEIKVNKIVTDPPWGAIDKSLNIENFYGAMMESFYKISADKAIVVLLTPHTEIIKDYIGGAGERFELLASFTGRVSGFESSIMKILVKK